MSPPQSEQLWILHINAKNDWFSNSLVLENPSSRNSQAFLKYDCDLGKSVQNEGTQKVKETG